MVTSIRGLDNFNTEDYVITPDSSIFCVVDAFSEATPNLLFAHGVSSITDNGTGNLFFNFTNPMADINYLTLLSASNKSPNGSGRFVSEMTNDKTIARSHIKVKNTSGTLQTTDRLTASFIRS